MLLRFENNCPKGRHREDMIRCTYMSESLRVIVTHHIRFVRWSVFTLPTEHHTVEGREGGQGILGERRVVILNNMVMKGLIEKGYLIKD